MGKRIARRRKELGMTQDEVAEKAGLTPQTVSSAERGTKALRPENIVRLCQALKVTPNDLLIEADYALQLNTTSSVLSELSPQKRLYLDEVVRLLVEAFSQVD